MVAARTIQAMVCLPRQSNSPEQGGQQREAFPFDQAPKYLLRDRDRIFGSDFTKQVQLGID
jgi:hypothetical protein